jgi:hypothetical protein
VNPTITPLPFRLSVFLGGICVKATAQQLAVGTLVVLGVLRSVSVFGDDMISFATGGYATGLRTMETMEMIDTDKDGNISQAEWTAFQNKVFSALDKHNTGYIDAKQFYGDPMGPVSVAPGGFILGLRTKEMFEKIGPNTDGKISRQQYLQYQQKIFDMMDTQKKHMLTATEFILHTP